MTYIPNNVTAPGQLVVINPITGTPLEAGNPKYPMGPGAWGVPGMLNPNIFSNFYVTVELQEFTPVWQQAMEKTHRFNQDPKNDLTQVLAQLSSQDRKTAEAVLNVNPGMVGLRASDPAAEKLQQTLVGLRLAQIRANQILTLKEVVAVPKQSESMWVQSTAPSDFMIVVTDIDGQEHKFKAVFFNRDQNLWAGQNYFNQGFQPTQPPSPYQGTRGMFSQAQPQPQPPSGFMPSSIFQNDFGGI